ncbi:hypothetical protein SteCoe_6846 [Stentor coeruleus]|uniref:Uncharacterized protein n=1 Tax=Stentor coeruleus TaxID=5963 RepID=A0A1R2CP27_9CILI|nr:hypothetical protein SteCoe_6846 [Stentor coeruleus]
MYSLRQFSDSGNTCDTDDSEYLDSRFSIYSSKSIISALKTQACFQNFKKPEIFKPMQQSMINQIITESETQQINSCIDIPNHQSILFDRKSSPIEFSDKVLQNSCLNHLNSSEIISDFSECKGEKAKIVCIMIKEMDEECYHNWLPNPVFVHPESMNFATPKNVFSPSKPRIFN